MRKNLAFGGKRTPICRLPFPQPSHYAEWAIQHLHCPTVQLELPIEFSFYSDRFSLASTLYNSVNGPFFLSIYGSVVLLFVLSRFLSFLILYTAGRTLWAGDQPVARPLPPHRTRPTQNKRMPQVEFETTIPVFERAKTVHLFICSELPASEFASLLTTLHGSNTENTLPLLLHHATAQALYSCWGTT
jgi:hypothetical protein